MVPVTAVAVIGAGAAVGPVVADASPDLPDITAQQLLTNVQTAKVDGMSGTVRMTADLGLPALPGGGQGPNEMLDLLAGKTTLRVAYAGPDKARVSILDDMAERVFVTDGSTAWAYDSAEREARKFTVPAHDTTRERPEGMPDPQTIAKRVLDAIDPSTQVTVTGTRSVAGRDAYLLTLTPRTDRTTVGSVTLAVDAREWVPLRVTVMPRSGDEPAIQVGFSSVSFQVPQASTFSFSPPKGTDVTVEPEHAKRDRPAVPRKAPEHKTPDHKATKDRPTVIGTGWDAVWVGRWNRGNDPQLEQLLAAAPTVSGSWGSGKVLTSRMVSALLTDDGRVLVGLVPTSVLEQAAVKAPR
jgi:outer membrane lipoprotein-sorting protein